MISSEQPYKEYFASTVWPKIKDDYEKLRKRVPKRIAERVAQDKAKNEKATKDKPEAKAEAKKDKKGDPVQEKLGGIIKDAKEKGEARNRYMNLAWTGPIDNTPLQESISLGKVENVAADMFLKHLPTAGAAATAGEGEAADDVEGAPQSKPQQRAVDILKQKQKKPWSIPPAVEKGFEIPIMVSSVNQSVVPELGKFKRLAMDVVVNATWLALFWAKEDGDENAVTALEGLILDWPFDFVHIKGSTAEEIEENKFKWAVNLSARHERLRDFTGLENSNLLRIVAKAADIVKSHATGGAQPSPEKVHKWLFDNVSWGVLHCPTVDTVKRHMQNWAALPKCSQALTLIEQAVTRWGRDNLLDWPTKLAAIVAKTDANSLGYVVEALFTRMWRMNKKDPYSSGSTLNGEIAEILWVRTYVSSFLRQFPDLFKSPSCNSEGSNTTQGTLAEAACLQTARSYLDSPLKFFLQTEGPDKDPTWIQSLPSEALRLTMRHFLDLSMGFYKPEIVGALSQPRAEKYSLERFHKNQRVPKRFFEPFQIAYDSLVAVHKPVEEKTADATEPAADGAKGVAKDASAQDKKSHEVTPSDVTSFRKKCEEACEAQLEGRMVIVIAEGTDVEIHKSITQTRMYQNLTDHATLMGFYDVKNARLCNVFEGQPLTHREPALDEADLERYLKSLAPLMVGGRDVLWVLTGRTEANVPKIKRLLGKQNFVFQQYHLCYNIKQMQQYGHFKRQRGFANSRSHEVMLIAYKGRLPKNLPRVREHVDAGSNVWCEVVKNVPVLHQKNHALVTKGVREQSLQAMVGTCVTEVEAQERAAQGLPEPVQHDDDDGAADAETADAATAGPPEKKVVDAALKKRKLYRQLTGTEVPWFPHDNDFELLKELVHEAGKPRWVYFGTPAGGAGIHGCIEKGCSVLALCYDDHHRKNLEPFLTERAVEAMASGHTMVFQNEVLHQRSVQLRLTKEEKEKEEKEEKKEAKKEEKKEDNKAENKKTPAKKTKKKKTKKKDDSSSSSDSDPTSDDDAPKKKKQKKEKD